MEPNQQNDSPPKERTALDVLIGLTELALIAALIGLTLGIVTGNITIDPEKARWYLLF